MTPSRPTASVVVAFAGSATDLIGLVAELGRLVLREGDEVIVADNRPGSMASGQGAAVMGPGGRAPGSGAVRVLPAGGIRAPGFARNQGARVARGEWLVFIDADTAAAPSLLDLYFSPAPAADTAMLAGAIEDRPGGDGPAARHSAERGQMSQQVTLRRRGSPYAQTANCAVRRTAFEAVGGFDESARCGEDADLCFRLAAAGWSLEERPHAGVEHRTRATLAALLGQLARHGAGAAWLERRYPGEFPSPRPREVAGRAGRSAAAMAVALARGRGGAAAAAAVDILAGFAFDAGRLLSNRPRGADGPRLSTWQRNRLK
jgi:GT2 family glycosyltransferase